MDRLNVVSQELHAAIEELAREKDITRRRETELEQQLLNERNAHSARESALLEANGKLLLRVEELSDSIARLQAQIMELTKSQNMHLMTIASASMRPQGSLNSEHDLANSRLALRHGHSTSDSFSHTSPMSSNTRNFPATSDFLQFQLPRDQKTYFHGNPNSLHSLVNPGQTASNYPSNSVTQSFAHDIEKEIESMRNVTNAIAKVTEVSSPLDTKSAISAQYPKSAYPFGQETVEAMTNSYPIQDDFDYSQTDPRHQLELTRPDVRVGPYDIIGTSLKASSPVMSAPSPPKQVATVSYFPTTQSRDLDKEPMMLTPEMSRSSNAHVHSNLVTSASHRPLRSNENSPQPAKPAAPKVTAQQFFNLIRKHVQPASLEKLMAALASFNSGKINKQVLLETASEVLNVPDVPLEGTNEVVDLVSTFKLLILKG